MDPPDEIREENHLKTPPHPIDGTLPIQGHSVSIAVYELVGDVNRRAAARVGEFEAQLGRLVPELVGGGTKFLDV